MRKVQVLAGLALALTLLMAGAGCKSNSSNSYGPTGPGPMPSVPPNTVVMSNLAFSPTSITVSKNTTVTWMNSDNTAHTSTSDSGVWDTGSIAPGASKTTMFTAAGTYTFHCTFHTYMKGTVIVQ